MREGFMFEDMEYMIAGRTKSILVVSLLALLIWQYSAGHPYTAAEQEAETFIPLMPYMKWCFVRLLNIF